MSSVTAERRVISSRPLIEIEGLSMSYTQNGGSLEVLNGLSLCIAEGELVSIVGPSGCGKSTLLKIIGGLIAAYSGRVLVGGGAPTSARQRREFGFVFQNAVLFSWRTVIQNIMLPFEVFSSGTRNEANWGKWISRANEMIELVGLGGFEHVFPHQLSGGMQSRVSLARALSYSPKILLMDEPFGALDEITRTRLNMDFLRLQEVTEATVILITHSLQEAVFLSDRVLVMSPRPSKISYTLQVDLPRPRPIEIQDTNEFVRQVSSLREHVADRSYDPVVSHGTALDNSQA